LIAHPMLPTAYAAERPSDEREKLIIALDVESAGEAQSLVRELNPYVGAFKIGLQLFTAEGPGFVRKLVDEGARIFLDLKFHDIPNTVSKAAVEAARLGVWMFNVHASGGSEMMRAAYGEMANACERESIEKPKMTAVTVLTSSGLDTLRETGVTDSPENQVLRLSKLTAECGLDGVVASPREIAAIRSGIDSTDFLIVTPGIRPVFATNDDQKRVMTPGEALREGASHLVIGRPVTAAHDRVEAVRKIIEEIT
jgi:orotidine-5'-phosphate decarboxylase